MLTFFAGIWMQFRGSRVNTRGCYDERSESISPLLLGEGGREAAWGEVKEGFGVGMIEGVVTIE